METTIKIMEQNITAAPVWISIAVIVVIAIVIAAIIIYRKKHKK